jgi:hypothetical protein
MQPGAGTVQHALQHGNWIDARGERLPIGACNPPMRGNLAGEFRWNFAFRTLDKVLPSFLNIFSGGLE